MVGVNFQIALSYISVDDNCAITGTYVDNRVGDLSNKYGKSTKSTFCHLIQLWNRGDVAFLNFDLSIQGGLIVEYLMFGAVLALVCIEGL
jgi:hypothetical protein